MEIRLEGVDVKTIGPTGFYGDLQWITRWGEGACGMFEASWSMPLPPDFEHPLLRRGSLVEIMDGPWRIGSPLILSEPAKGAGLDNPWAFTAAGIGREVEGSNSYYALDGSGNSTDTSSTAVDQAIARGWRIAGRAANVGAASATVVPVGDLVTVGALLAMVGDRDNTRWGVGQDNLVRFLTAPTTPTYHVVPGAAALGVADDDYATAVLVRYLDSTSHTYATVTAPATPSAVQIRYGRREYAVDLTDRGEIAASSAQSRANGILALAKGRLGWANGLTLTSNDLLTEGGTPVGLSTVEAGQMIRLHGIWSDLLETNGQTWLDIIIGETRYTDGATSIYINPLGLAARDLAAIVEEVSGPPATG